MPYQKQAEAAAQRPSRDTKDRSAAVVGVAAAAAAALESAETALVNAPDETAGNFETAGVAPRFEALESVGGRDEGALGVWRHDGGRGEVVAELRQLQSSGGGNTGGNYQVDLVSFDLASGRVGLGWFVGRVELG